MNWFTNLFRSHPKPMTLTREAPPIAPAPATTEPASPPARVYVAKAASSFPAPDLLRVGRWVMTPDGVGILARFPQPNVAEVHLVNADGGTKESRTYTPSQINQAALAEIPAPRRPDQTRAAALGYR